MIRLTRFLTVLVVALALIAGPVLSAFAQDANPVCQGLSAADCELLRSAMKAQQRLTSISVPAWSINLYLTAEQESVFFEAHGSAAASLPAELAALRDAFLDIEMVTPDTLRAFLGQIDSATVQTILNNLLLSLVVDGFELETPEESIAGSGALLFKDSAIYLNLPAPSAENTWFGEPLEITETDLAELDVALAQLRAALLDEEMDEAFDAAGALLTMQQDIAALVQQHITTTRLPDDALGGQPVAVFTTTFNLKDLLADPSLAPTLMMLLKNLAEQNPDMTEMELNQPQLQLALVALDLMLTEGAFTSSQWVGLDDGHLHRVTFDGTLNLDLSLFNNENEDVPVGPVIFSVSLAADFEDFDAVTPDQIISPATFYPTDEIDNFLVGTPNQIESVVAVGDVINRTMPFDGDTHIFALPLEAGESIILTLESESFPYLSVYNPDAFLVDTLSTYSGEPLSFTADSAGVHFITVEGYSKLSYRLTISAG